MDMMHCNNLRFSSMLSHMLIKKVTTIIYVYPWTGKMAVSIPRDQYCPIIAMLYYNLELLNPCLQTHFFSENNI